MSNTVAGRRQFDNSQECIAKNASGVAMRMKIRQSKTPQFKHLLITAFVEIHNSTTWDVVRVAPLGFIFFQQIHCNISYKV